MQKWFGFVGDHVLQQPQFWHTRRLPKIYESFKKGYEAQTGKPLTEPLLASLDRGSMMLPSKLN